MSFRLYYPFGGGEITPLCFMIQIGLSLYFLWRELGPSVLAGLGLMILLVPVNYYLSNVQRKYQFSQMKFKDDRIKLINEILNGIKVSKRYVDVFTETTWIVLFRC